jgi:hypothetical protein
MLKKFDVSFDYTSERASDFTLTSPGDEAETATGGEVYRARGIAEMLQDRYERT